MKLPIQGIQSICSQSIGMKDGDHEVYAILDVTNAGANGFVFVAIEWTEQHGFVLVTEVPPAWIDEFRQRTQPKTRICTCGSLDEGLPHRPECPAAQS